MIFIINSLHIKFVMYILKMNQLVFNEHLHVQRGNDYVWQ
jgi:hypothetical protein